MQTFIIDWNLAQNFKYLDPKRAFKQLVEAVQLLDGIVNKKDGWRTHPARKAWENNPVALFTYIESLWDELVHRKIAVNSNLHKKAKELINNNEFENVQGKFPDWWGREDIAASHRSRLRCKGFIDAACVDIKRDLKLKSIDRWLKENFGLMKNALKFKHLELLLKTSGVDFKTPSHYEQFGWTEDPAGEYIWPV